jgi:hypothetical protein
MVRKLPWHKIGRHGTYTNPIQEEEREAAAILSLKLVAQGQSGPCICDRCIVRIWRPLIIQLGDKHNPPMGGWGNA